MVSTGDGPLYYTGRVRHIHPLVPRPLANPFARVEVVEFATPFYSCLESDGTVECDVVRAGPLDGVCAGAELLGFAECLGCFKQCLLSSVF